MNLSKEEIFAFNAGLKQAQWQITKAMMALSATDCLYAETKRLLKFIHDEIEKEQKEGKKTEIHAGYFALLELAGYKL